VYWIKNHVLPVLYTQIDDWFCTPYFMVLWEDVYSSRKPVRVVKCPDPEHKLPPDDILRGKITQLKNTDPDSLLPILEMRLTGVDKYIKDIDRDLIWELTVFCPAKGELDTVYISPFYLGWILYRLGFYDCQFSHIKESLDWMVPPEKDFLLLYKGGELKVIIIVMIID